MKRARQKNLFGVSLSIRQHLAAAYHRQAKQKRWTINERAWFAELAATWERTLTSRKK